ncbi:MAG: hypothetical protein JWQ14_1869 [Adhaeribacter sp.]|nr:hypothetical protein [Adhaeribacter sp.]
MLLIRRLLINLDYYLNKKLYFKYNNMGHGILVLELRKNSVYNSVALRGKRQNEDERTCI